MFKVQQSIFPVNNFVTFVNDFKMHRARSSLKTCILNIVAKTNVILVYFMSHSELSLVLVFNKNELYK